MITQYELSLSPDYVPDWTLVDAIRELFQNALDQQTIDPSNTMSFGFHLSEEHPYLNRLLIGNKTSTLTTKSLLLGNSTKRTDDRTIGKFGEGYKIAALVLTRLGKRFTIYNNTTREIWSFHLVDSTKYQSKILVVEVVKQSNWEAPSEDDLLMAIDGITLEEFEDIKKSNLHMQKDVKGQLTSYGRILLDSEQAGRVYVNGLFVSTVKDFKYGYDLKPQYIKIDRDRRTIADWDLSWITSQMWLSTNSDRIVELAKQNAKDVQHIKYHIPAVYTPPYLEKAADDFKKEYGYKAAPVTTQIEAHKAKKQGYTPIIVSEPMKQLLDSSGKVGKSLKPNPKALTTYDRFNKWYRRYRKFLDEDSKEHFRELLRELKDKEKEDR